MVAPRYLVDANLCIDVLDDPASNVGARLQGCEIGEVVTSAIVYAEVMIGAERRRKGDRARALFAQLPVLPFDEAAGRAYSLLPFKRGSYDRLIAAHALALGLTLVTSNVADFCDVPKLNIEDWTA